MSFYIPIILFFTSLFGIVFMLYRKLSLVEQGVGPSSPHPIELDLDIEKAKRESVKHLKKIGYVILFVTLRTFIKLTHFTKQKSMLICSKAKERWHKNRPKTENKEVSKYLKTISEYRSRIRTLKHQIKEEEGIE